MNIMINKITPEQTALFPEWTKKWVDIGLSTVPADFDTATKAALELYKLLKLPPPKVVLHLGSPYAICIGGVSALKQLNISQVESQVWSQVWSQVYSQVHSQVWSQVYSQVHSQVWSQVHSQVWSQVYSQVHSQVHSQVRSQVKEGLNNYYGGQFWAAWCAFVSFLRDVLKWKSKVLESFALFETITKSCGGVWWHEDVLAISDRPQEIHLDQERRLHSTVGPSIAYRDGWKLYHVHGTAIPSEWIEKKDEVDFASAFDPNNPQRNKALMEVMGV